MPPLVFTPILKRLRWGGRRLGTVLGKPLGPFSDYAESWELCDHGDDQSIVSDGPLAGRTLHDLVVEHGVELLGRHAPRRQFPLLIKFLDARDRLSVQVHPDDEQARRFDPQENGKTEAWVVIDAEPGSLIFAGLQPHIDRQRLEAALAAHRVAECLHSFPARAGDAVFVPAGTVHAIGEGVLLAEVQQPSALTFRLDDWGRLDAAGRPRALHIPQALECIDYRCGPVGPVTPRRLSSGEHTVEELVCCEYFVLRRHTARRSFGLERDDRFHAVLVLAGAANLVVDGTKRPLLRGSTVLVPAVCPPVELEPSGNSCGEVTLLEAFLP